MAYCSLDNHFFFSTSCQSLRYLQTSGLKLCNLFTQYSLSLNVQVLTSLEPVDYLVVSFLPGISEVLRKSCLSSLFVLQFIKLVIMLHASVSSYYGMSVQELLFRGALLPLTGNNWNSVLLVATLFGILHLGSGRKSSFAIWYV